MWDKCQQIYTRRTRQIHLQEEANSLDLNKHIKVSDLRQLEKTGLVMKETLRMHPPLITITRKLEKEMEFDNYRIPKNAFVNIVFQLSHHDKRSWSNPATFDPERFNKQRNEQLKCPFGYAPFGAGKHHCIGFNFAEILVKLSTSILLKYFKISVPDDYECPIQDVPLKQPKDNLPLYLQKNHK